MKQFSGIVTSTKMNKTIVVTVSKKWMHPIYKKTVKRTQKYLVHDPQEKAKEGDEVTFAESKPISKRKRFKLVSIN